ncbi:hypothetical protein XELAEV_18047742mg [Xenopus laevis]|uniref:Uncharacterized protein n=1 Tax=Xenopus laevis TaxID=8355 RepID=A0A974H1U2_XENLA|nr:hypothetical protein XELAEV_18047742mg [Xenopus laevis]
MRVYRTRYPGMTQRLRISLLAPYPLLKCLQWSHGLHEFLWETWLFCFCDCTLYTIVYPNRIVLAKT